MSPTVEHSMRHGRPAAERRLARRAGAALAAVVALSAVLSPAPAHGQAAKAELVPARLFVGWAVYERYTRIAQLVVWNATPGSLVALSCIHGNNPTARAPGSSCVKSKFYQYTVPASGFIDLTRRVRRWHLTASRFAESSTNVSVWTFDGPADRYPSLDKLAIYKARQGREPVRDISCNLHTRSPSGETEATLVDCAEVCPPPPDLLQLLPVSTYCEGAGQLLPPPRFGATFRRAGRAGGRITSLRVGGLPTQPPFSNPSVAVVCTGRACPFGARFFAASRGPLLIRGLRRRVLPPGTTIDIWVMKGNFIGRVQRYEVKRRRLVASSLCAYPAELLPERCPPG